MFFGKDYVARRGYHQGGVYSVVVGNPAE